MINAFTLKVTLFNVETSADSYGKQKYQINEESTIMAMETNITRSEFYEASRSGYKISRVIRINNFLYKGQRFIGIDKKIYKVIKTYQLSHLLELTLENTSLKELEGWLV